MQQLAVIDQHGTQIGRTFPKRAKQLISKQRALWKDETHSAICLLPELKEDLNVNNDYADTRSGKSEDLLMYMAKSRVNKRAKLNKHLTAFLIAIPVLAVLYALLFDPIEHPMYYNAREISYRINEALSTTQDAPLFVPEAGLPEEALEYAEEYAEQGVNAYTQYMDDILMEAHWVIDRGIMTNYTSPIWYVLIGAYIAWGVWIAASYIKMDAVKLRRRRTARVKPDPVELEYHRLKDLAEEGLEF